MTAGTAGVAIALSLLLGAGLVLSQLMRLKSWLKNSPPLPPPIEVKDDDDDDA